MSPSDSGSSGSSPSSRSAHARGVDVFFELVGSLELLARPELEGMQHLFCNFSQPTLKWRSIRLLAASTFVRSPIPR